MPGLVLSARNMMVNQICQACPHGLYILVGGEGWSITHEYDNIYGKKKISNKSKTECDNAGGKKA